MNSTNSAAARLSSDACNRSPRATDVASASRASLLALLVLLAVVAFASRTGFGHASNTTPTPGYVNWAMSVFLILFVLMIPVAVYAYSVQMREFRVQNRRSMQARAIGAWGSCSSSSGSPG